MDAIRKKMQSLKSETDQLYATIYKHEQTVKEANSKNDEHEVSIRDLGKKIQTYEVNFDETNDKLTKVLAGYEEKEKEFKSAEEDVGALSRRWRRATHCHEKGQFRQRLNRMKTALGRQLEFHWILDLLGGQRQKCGESKK